MELGTHNTEHITRNTERETQNIEFKSTFFLKSFCSIKKKPIFALAKEN